jgi:O-acetyl-ADP-ribose deacetylase (regulator of RNase III)
MIKFAQGNLLESGAEALVNTVNTVGVMGKGVALMFKEAFPENFRAYQAACRANELEIGKLLVTRRDALLGPKWIINFPTKKHWRHPSKIEWIEAGLMSLKEEIARRGIQSIALPPLGSGNGGLDWQDVRQRIINALGSLADVEVTLYEPTAKYQNVVKRNGTAKLTPARALVAELVRRYSVIGIACTLLEVQKLAYFLERSVVLAGGENPLDLRFEANKYGPYAARLTHMLNSMDGTYLRCEKRLADAGPFDLIGFVDEQKDRVAAYLRSAEAKPYTEALEDTARLIDGFESPLGMELLSTVDWLLRKEGIKAETDSIRTALGNWPGGAASAHRKSKIFDERLIELALERLTTY